MKFISVLSQSDAARDLDCGQLKAFVLSAVTSVTSQ